MWMLYLNLGNYGRHCVTVMNSLGIVDDVITTQLSEPLKTVVSKRSVALAPCVARLRRMGTMTS